MTSRHPIQARVRAVAIRARRLRQVLGWSWWLAALLVAALLVGVLDALLRFRDPGVRLIGSAAVAAVAVWTFYRFVYPTLRHSQNDVQVAQRIERRFPQLRDRLSSTVAFLSQDVQDATAGSPDLRRAVVSQTVGETESLNFFECLDSSRTRRAAGVALVCVALVAAAYLAAPRTTSLAATRLVIPWGGPEWPRQHNLVFQNVPARLARGQDFVATVVDQNGTLPEQVEIEYRIDDEIQTRPMRFTDGKMVHRFNSVSQSFAFRAKGGDHQSMPWQEVAVVDPPELTDFRVSIQPPSYTTLPEFQQEEPRIVATQGSSLAISGTSSKSLEEVVLRIEQPEMLANAYTLTIPGQLDESRRRFRIAQWESGEPLVLAESGRYWLELTDSEAGSPAPTQRWEIRVKPDSVPQVTVQEPLANLTVTNQAIVPFEVSAQDDLGVQDVTLQYVVGDATGPPDAPDELLLYGAGSSSATQAGVATVVGEPTANSSSGSGLAAGATGSSRPPIVLRYAWDLRQIPDLKPYDVIELKVVARDFKPQQAESSLRRITIVSVEELEERVAQKRSFILAQLAEVLRVQRQARSQTRSLQIQLDETDGRFRSSDVNRLQSGELNQRRVRQLLDQSGDGVEAQILQLLEDIERNRLENADVVTRMTELLEIVRQLARQDLPLIERELLTSLRSARETLRNREPRGSDEAQEDQAASSEGSGSGDARDSERTSEDSGQSVDPLVASSLEQAGQGQDAVIEQLEQLLGELSEWDSYRRFSRMVGRLLSDQLDLLRDTEKVRLDTLTKEANDLTDQEKSDLRQLSQRQLEIARRVESLQSTMQELQAQLEQSDRAAAQTVSDARETARRLAISGQMRESARKLEQNQVGQATDHQQESTDALNELLDVLANRREHELGRRVRKLEQARDDLREVAEQQKGLRARFEKAAAQADQDERKRQLEQLQKEQQELQNKTEELGRRLQRLQAESARESVDAAQQQQQQTRQSAQNDDANAAKEQADQAARLLEQAQRQVEQQIQAARQELAAEQLAMLEQTLKGFEIRQQAMLETTMELGDLLMEQGEWRPEQQVSLSELAVQQLFLAREVGDQLPQFKEAEAFSLALRSVTRQMTDAATLLEGQEAGSPTQELQQGALKRLRQLLAALEPEVRTQPADTENPMAGGQQNPPSNSAAQGTLAELKLVQLMQKEISTRTRELEEIRQQSGELAPAERQELSRLAAEQGRLSQILLNLSVAASSDEDLPNDMELPIDPSDADNDLDLPSLDKALEESLQQP